MILEWRDKNNERKRKSVSTGLPVKNNKRKAMQMLHEKIEECRAELMRQAEVADNTTLFSDWLLIWLRAKQSALAPNTYENYVSVVERKVIPFFCERKTLLCELTRDDLQDYYTFLAKNCNAKGSTIRHHHSYINNALKLAVQKGYLAHNPAKYMNLPKKVKYQATILSPEQIKQLITAVAETSLEIPVILTCYYGFRRSEVLGLTWDAIDFENDVITVMRKVYASHGGGNTKIVLTDELKTESSRRSLPLIPAAKAYLLELRARQEENRKRFGNAYVHDYDNAVCVWSNGELIKPDYISHNFKALLTQNGLPEIRFHDLRHSCASMLVNNGESLKHIQEWLGHADFGTTANIYSHISVQSKREMGETVSKLLA